ncbi:hypothetical protein AVEN_136813-1 [Araneus ventricosus]|uniref:CCHC-type domain-containing protein n=1 Tax=Araneus ventricosus TaxID=182803 RepID=A0A4Y2NZ15_ARAVE|nr:hypothetical protein AVEN_136813-1 [Araneus ventricosus]
MKNTRNEKKFKNKSREIDKVKITCFSCRKKGLYARDCPSKSRGKANHVPERTKGPNYSAFSSEIKRTVERSEDQWILDSGASAHMIYNLNYFYSLSESTENEVICLGNDIELPVKGKGDVKIKKLIHGIWQEGEIHNVLHVPDLKKNLLPEGMIATKGMKIVKMQDYADIYNCENELFGTAVRSASNLYNMLFRTVTYPEVNISHKNNLKIWHERTGHTNLKALCEFSETGIMKNRMSQTKKGFFCEGCQYMTNNTEFHPIPWNTKLLNLEN